MRSPARHGFTPIELLLIVIITSILVAIALPKIQNARSRSKAATMQSDLRNLATAQEAFFYSHAMYTSDLTRLRYQKSPGVVLTVTNATGTGWSAVATNPTVSPLRCALYKGDVPAQEPATVEGLIGCQ